MLAALATALVMYPSYGYGQCFDCSSAAFAFTAGAGAGVGYLWW